MYISFFHTATIKFCRSPRRGANSIPNFKEIENWENDVIFAIPISLKLKLQKMTSFSLTNLSPQFLIFFENEVAVNCTFVPFNSSNWGRGELQI
ncbi:MAG: hypothetical protein EBU46_10395 [Nitrosomonadaceae bacterium]|nr:hypothetical protein [Nitrosomonadaceae bacterium]